MQLAHVHYGIKNFENTIDGVYNLYVVDRIDLDYIPQIVVNV
jgi:hypothetical protein